METLSNLPISTLPIVSTNEPSLDTMEIPAKTRPCSKLMSEISSKTSDHEHSCMFDDVVDTTSNKMFPEHGSSDSCVEDSDVSHLRPLVNMRPLVNNHPAKGEVKKNIKHSQEIEPLLTPDENRFVMFPIEHHDIWKLYKKAVDSFWKVEDVDLSKDLADWEGLNKDEKYFIKMVLAFFSSSDGIVNENLSMRFSNEVQSSEVRAFYSFQNFMETIHCVTGETKILTNKGYFEIQDLLDQTVHVWNGNEFSEVVIRYTGDQEIYRVELTNGMSVDCTPGHKWLIQVENQVERIETKTLLQGNLIAQYHVPCIMDSEDPDEFMNPYIHGFFCGDTGDRLPPSTLNKPILEVPINYSISTKVRWLEGYVDANGSIQRIGERTELHISERTEMRSIGVPTQYDGEAPLRSHISSMHGSFLKHVQLMLTTMGVLSNIRSQDNEPNVLSLSAASVLSLMKNGFSPKRLNLEHLCLPCSDDEEMIQIQSIHKISESEKTYCFNEPIHHAGIFNGILTCQSEMYSQLIDTYIRDNAEKMTLFQATQNFPFIKKKAEWAKRWILDNRSSFSTRLVAFAIVEGIFFSSSFAAIFWLKQRNILPGLCLSNEYISRDEALHVEHAIMLYHKLKRRMAKKKFIEIMKEAVDIEIDFICNSIPCRLIGMNQTLMSDYIRFVADRLCAQLGYEKIYGVSNPLPFMELISVEKKTNFFEHRVSEYSLANKTFDENVFDMTEF